MKALSRAVSSSQTLIAQARTDGTALVLNKGEIDSEINRLEGQIFTIVEAAEQLKAEEALAAAKKEAVGLQEAIDELKVTIDAQSKRLHETSYGITHASLHLQLLIGLCSSSRVKTGESFCFESKR